MPARVKWLILSALAITLLALMPQIHLWLARGSEWHGAYATLQGDEFLYSAYVNALIEGRPRKNDPFSGRDDHPSSPLPESTFSIQFFPAYAMATAARLSGASASTGFIVLLGVTGLLASLTAFWLFTSVTGDGRLAGAGVLFVLCFGTFAAGQGLGAALIGKDVMFVGLPFLRRYQPSAAFPLFFAFCALVWHMLTVEGGRAARACALTAGVTLGVLVFSYLYLWTAAAAWFACVAALWLYFRPGDRQRALEAITITSAMAAFALLPYTYFLSHRPASLDETQTMTMTRAPDLLRVPEMIGLLTLILLVAGRARLEGEPSRAVFASSFALLPFLVFNQQILTGRSMQPFHYEVFIANYAALVGLVITVSLLWPIPRRVLAWVAALSFLFGTLEVNFPAGARSTIDTANDETIPALVRLNELSKDDGTWSSLRAEGQARALVFSPHIDLLKLLPTWASQPSLLGMGSLDFGSASRDMRKELVSTHLYLCGKDADYLRSLLHDTADDKFLSYYTRSTLFGHERVLKILTPHFMPITLEEIETEARTYEAFVKSFSREQVARRPFAYLLVRADKEFDFTRIDHWYERDGGEKVGAYNIYKVRLRD